MSPDRKTKTTLPSLLARLRGAFTETEERDGYFFRRTGKFRFHKITNIETIQDVLKHPEEYRTPSFVKKAMDRFIRDSMILQYGEAWENLHRIVMPVFNDPGVRAYVAPVVLEESGKMLDRWEKGEPFDAEREMRGMTARVIMRSIFSDTLKEEEAEEIIDAASVTIESFRNPTLVTKLSRIAGMPVDFVWPLKKSYRDARRRVNKVLDDALARRRAEPEGRTDLLSLLMAGRDHRTGKPLSDAQIKGNLILFIVAGHETSAISLTLALNRLLEHPEEIRKIRKQVAEVAQGGPVRPEHVRKLTRCRNAFLEASRMDPAAYELARESRVKADLRGCVHMEKGDVFLVDSRVVHRDPRNFDAPGTFNPDRFGHDEGLIPRKSFKPLLSFGGGKRVCTGRSFAIVEGTLALADIFNRVSLRVLEKPAGVRPVFTLRLDGHLRLRAEPLP